MEYEIAMVETTDLPRPDPRRRWLVVVLVLVAILILALVLWLFLTVGEAVRRTAEGAPSPGLVSELVIDGPGVGDHPGFGRPMGVAWSPDGSRIYVADAEHDRICVFDQEGRFIREFGGRGIAKPAQGVRSDWDEGELNYPLDVAVDDEGQVYVADFHNDSISVFTADGEFERRFPDPLERVGKGASGAGGTGIAVTSLAIRGDRVFATDRYQVVVFDTQGEVQDQFGRPGTGEGGLDHPNGIAVDTSGTVYVSDSNNSRVVALTDTGRQLWTLGAGAADGEVGLLALPRGADVLASGELIVADPVGQRLVRVAPDGSVARGYGEPGDTPTRFAFPNDVSVSDGRLLVADRANRRVQVVRFDGE